MGDFNRAVGILDEIVFVPVEKVGKGINIKSYSIQEISLGFELIKTLRETILRDRELKSELVKAYVDVINNKGDKIVFELIDYVKQNFNMVLLTRQNKNLIFEQFIKNNFNLNTGL
ncbi:hypothetical protein PL321_06960 [Caloramator sp. mosi_1]|uniref:hypothetical protein n=1 Tax=Caloramator sp. mosi_1 TaxID=3023090 RepID=UPI002361EDCE|nr:hypothetical protein [Caloramator sp. mosi_1]WDC85197.1 hypothetical protein PL321_06960 [Caloramator sp. mosi_1]